MAKSWIRTAPAAGRRTGRRLAWRALVPVACLAAGYLFAVSARASHGTDIRPPGTAGLAGLVVTAERQVRGYDAQAAGLQRRLDRATRVAGNGNSAVARAQAAVARLGLPAGLRAVSGPGVEVVLDDAPASELTTGVDPNILVVHQSDLQAVVNALWAGGAEAMSIAGQRVIATSAVRCVGNTLLLNGEVYSPPFRVVAIGPAAPMKTRLAASPGVRLFEQAATYYDLGYSVAASASLTVPSYVGSLTLRYARPGG
jgi:uncharacterized protein YlxW (UPF0749 family)